MLQTQKSKHISQLVQRLGKRTDKLTNVEDQFFSHIVKIQQIYTRFSNKLTDNMIIFEEDINKIGFYAIDKSQQASNLFKLMKQFCISINNNAQVNLLNLKGVNRDRIIEQQNKFTKKIDTFLGTFKEYIKEQQLFNKSYNVYEKLCNLLDQLLERSSNFNDPISFYNETLSQDYIKELEDHYNRATMKEKQILNQIQLLDTKRVWFQTNLNEIKQSYFVLLHNHLSRIYTVAMYVTDPSKDRKVNKIEQTNKNDKSFYDQQPNNEFQKLEKVYRKQSQHFDQCLLNDFAQLFDKKIPNTSINSDYKLFLDRCKNYSEKKIKKMQQELQIKKKTQKHSKKLLGFFDDLEKDCTQMQKDIYGVNGWDNHPKRFRKFFGESFLEIQTLCFKLVQRPRRSLEKIKFCLRPQVQKMNKLVIEDQENLKSFENKISTIFKQHTKIKTKVQASQQIDAESFQQYKQSVKVSFNNFKIAVEQFEKAQTNINDHFSTCIKTIFDCIMKQAQNRSITKLLDKEPGKLNILKTLNIDRQVINIVKQEQKYDLLFGEGIGNKLYDRFTSKIKKKKYEETMKILNKKEEQARGLLMRQIGCFGNKKTNSKDMLSKMTCYMVEENKITYGSFYILLKGIRFKEKSFNLFKQNIQLLIPSRQICQFDKVITASNKQCIRVKTIHGPILFEIQDCDKVLERLQKDIAIGGIRQRSNDQKRDKSDSQSFYKNTTQDFKVSFQSQGLKSLAQSVDKKKKPSKGKQNSVMDQLEKLLRQQIFFKKMEVFLQPSKSKKNIVRIDYNYIEQGTSMKIKQRRTITHIQLVKAIQIQFQWKISFPDFPIVNSFAFQQTIRIDISAQVAKMDVLQEKSSEKTQFLRRRFFDEVKEMHLQMSKLVAKIAQKEVQTHVQTLQQTSYSSEEMININDINNEDTNKEINEQRSMTMSKLSRQRSLQCFARQDTCPNKA